MVSLKELKTLSIFLSSSIDFLIFYKYVPTCSFWMKFFLLYKFIMITWLSFLPNSVPKFAYLTKLIKDFINITDPSSELTRVNLFDVIDPINWTVLAISEAYSLRVFS